ncbi:MAG: LysM peptidoglycan-binding domain-containing protein [Clostridiales bacterium]|nr:LysM peptidoglycan-binding domain-containing protein [Clostridiales bacterium]
MRRPKYKIVKPIRFFVFILLTVMITVFAAYGLFSYSKAEAASVDTYVQVCVSENGNLWNIAERYVPDDIDIRDYIHEIREVNDITEGNLQPGDILFIPIH